MGKTLAIISPAEQAYSETFIQAHKKIPNLTVKFYSSGEVPKKLEGYGMLLKKDLYSKVVSKVKKEVSSIQLTSEEEALATSLKKEKIDVVMAEYGPTGVAVMKVCKMLKLPLVVHFHGYDASMHHLLEENGKYYQEMFQFASTIIAVSKSMEKKLLGIGCPREKLVYNTYGPNPNFFKITPSFEFKRFIGVGRFVDKKAPYYTILAFSKIIDKHPDATLVIGGKGELLSTCKNLVRYLGIEKNVSLPGVIKPEEFMDYLSNSLGFVQHSITADSGDMEGTPLAILESSAAGIPVISTIHAGIPDVIIHGKTGLLVNEHDIDGMAANMCKLLDDLDYTKKLGSLGKENIKNNFSMEKHLNGLYEIINK